MTGLRTLSLPDHGVKTKQAPEGPQVFDAVRRKWVALTPEEWVRQHFINHLIHDLGVPQGLLAVERTLTLNGLTKRADIMVHDRAGAPLALVECKAPGVPITQATFDQAARYNLVFKVKWLIITNGHAHFCCVVDHQHGTVRSMDHLPRFEAMLG